MAMTMAKRGRSTKMAENTRAQPRRRGLRRRVAARGGASTGAGFTGWPGRTRCSLRPPRVSPPCSPPSTTARSAVERPSVTLRRCATLPSPTTKTKAPCWSCSTGRARQGDGHDRLGALDRHADELPVDQFARRHGGRPAARLADRVRDQRAHQDGVGVAVDLVVHEVDPPGFRDTAGHPRCARAPAPRAARRGLRSGCAARARCAG